MKKIIKCTINSHPVEVEEGTTIIQAFKKLEKEIAHYCWHPGLSVAGVCRLCMVEIEGRNKLEIACNTPVQDGMVITNQSQKVKETVRWGLEFHLINHPLDCPICDQAGECVLQEQYMKFGAYQPLMSENKVKKRKVVDLGSKIVLDTERCILCARCTRFTDEVSKTKELGIFNRGDRSEIGIFKDKPLENDYALNTVDICPVGALTSKNFRFQQRVWYLKKAPSVCTGCSTGCNIDVYYNEEGLWRIRPRYSSINQYWMCDKGRETFKHVNPSGRLRNVFRHTSEETEKIKNLQVLQNVIDNSDKIGLVLTGCYTCEEYSAFLDFFQFDSIYHWKNNPETFEDYDNFLVRGDKNPNTKGLLESIQTRQLKLKDFTQLEENISQLDLLMVCGPENHQLYPCLEEKIKLFLKSKELVWVSPRSHASLQKPKNTVWTIPSKTYFEKTGTFVNHQGLPQKIKKTGSIVESACSLEDIVQILKKGKLEKPALLRDKMKANYFMEQKGSL